MMSNVRVAIADDDPFARAAVAGMLGDQEGVELIGRAGGVREITALVTREHPDVVVLDWLMPDGGGPKAARRIALMSPKTKIVGLTSSDSPQAWYEMMRAGANSFLIKGGPREQLLDAISAALDS